MQLTNSLSHDHEVFDSRNGVAASIEVHEKVAATTELGAGEANRRNELSSEKDASQNHPTKTNGFHDCCLTFVKAS